MANNKIESLYLKIPYDLRAVLLELEDAYGCEVGGGEVFDTTDGKGRKLTSEPALVRLTALFIGYVHLGYGSTKLSQVLGASKPLIYYANEQVPNHIETNVIFRTKLRGIAHRNGLRGLVDEIDKIEKKRAKI